MIPWKHTFAVLVAAATASSAIAQTTIYVNPAWSSTTPGADPDGPGPATNFSNAAWTLGSTADAYADLSLLNSWLAEGIPRPVTNLTDTVNPTVTSNAHGYSNGQSVTFTNTGVAALDGQVFTVSSATANTFVINLASAPGVSWSAARGYVQRSGTFGVVGGKIAPGRLILSAGTYLFTSANQTVANKLIIGPNNGISPNSHTRLPEAIIERCRLQLQGSSGVLGVYFNRTQSSGSGASGMLYSGLGNDTQVAFNRFRDPRGGDAFSAPMSLTDGSNNPGSRFSNRWISHNNIRDLALLQNTNSTVDGNMVAIRAWRADGIKVAFNTLSNLSREQNDPIVGSTPSGGNTILSLELAPVGWAVSDFVRVTGTGIAALDGNVFQISNVAAGGLTIPVNTTGFAATAGQVTEVFRVTSVVDNGATARITATNMAGIANGNIVAFSGTGIPALDGNQFSISGVSGGSFDVTATIAGGTNSGTGIATRVDAGFNAIAADSIEAADRGPLVFRNTLSNIRGTGISWTAGGGPRTGSPVNGGGVIGNTLTNAGLDPNTLTTAENSNRTAISLLSQSASTITSVSDTDPMLIQTAAAHGRAVGDRVGISGTGLTSLDGQSFVITAVPNTTTIEIDLPAAPGGTASAGFVGPLGVVASTAVINNTIVNTGLARHGIRFPSNADQVVHNLLNINNNNLVGPFGGLGLSRGDANRGGVSVNATANWWGAVTGPSGQGPGTGSAVDTFANFGSFLTSQALPGADTDGDGLFDSEEVALGTNANSADSDGDTLNDFVEVWSGLDPTTTTVFVDADNDGLPSTADPNDSDNDFDNDGVLDGAEIIAGSDINGTAPTIDINTGLATALGRTEIILPSMLTATDVQQTSAQVTFTITVAPTLGTLSVNTFTQAQLAAGLVTYTNTTSGSLDQFQFTVTDGASVVPGTFVITISTSRVDSDRDGLPNDMETLRGTNPNGKDSDGDGVEDGVEIGLGTNPNSNASPGSNADSDNDLIPDAFDASPSNADANGDRFRDGYALARTGRVNGAVTLGNVNGSGGVDFADGLLILRSFVNLVVLPPDVDQDVNRDGFIDNVDGSIIINWFLNNIPLLPFPK